jgi:hypothetical protein
MTRWDMPPKWVVLGLRLERCRHQLQGSGYLESILTRDWKLFEETLYHTYAIAWPDTPGSDVRRTPARRGLKKSRDFTKAKETCMKRRRLGLQFAHRPMGPFHRHLQRNVCRTGCVSNISGSWNQISYDLKVDTWATKGNPW